MKNNIKPSDLIKERDSLVKKIKNNWAKMSLANTEKDVKLSPKLIFKAIEEDSMKLIKVKIAIQAINLGIKSLKDLPENNLYGSIYMMQQQKETRTKLSLLPVNSGSEMNAEDVKKIISKLDSEIKKLSILIDEYNNFVEFEM